MKRLIFAVILAGLVATPAMAERLPFANFSGYSTTLVVANPSAERVSYALSGPQWPANVLEPFSVLRREAFGGEGGGIAEIPALPAGLSAYVEIIDPNGTRVRISPVGDAKRETAFLDLLGEAEGYAAFLFIHAAEGAVVQVAYDDATIELHLKPGTTQIVKAQGARAIVKALSDAPFSGFYGSGPVTAFGLMSKQPAGELMAVSGY